MNKNKDNPPIVGILLPCLNEEKIIDLSYNSIEKLYISLLNNHEISNNSFIAFIDDGSTDNTWEKILSIIEKSKYVKAIKLSKKFGHQNALLSGLFTFNQSANCLITIDVDLQDDINVIPQMIKCFNEGYEIVYGVRKERKKDTLLKKITASAFYRIMRIMGVNIIYNHADFRLAGSKAIIELMKFNEVNLFLRGIFPCIGFRTTTVFYDRLERSAGYSKFSIKKMFSFAVDGITSFSIQPLRFISILGILFFLISIILIIYAIYSYIFYNTTKGWMSTVIPIYFIGGVQLLCLGIIGEYLGKIYKETKARPRFIIEIQIL